MLVSIQTLPLVTFLDFPVSQLHDLGNYWRFFRDPSRNPKTNAQLRTMGGASSFVAMLAITGFLSATWTASRLSRAVGVSDIVLVIATGGDAKMAH